MIRFTCRSEHLLAFCQALDGWGLMAPSLRCDDSTSQRLQGVGNPMLITGQSIAPGKFPGADDFQSVDIRQVTGKRCKGRSQAHDALGGLVE